MTKLQQKKENRYISFTSQNFGQFSSAVLVTKSDIKIVFYTDKTCLLLAVITRWVEGSNPAFWRNFLRTKLSLSSMVGEYQFFSYHHNHLQGLGDPILEGVWKRLGMSLLSWSARTIPRRTPGRPGTWTSSPRCRRWLRKTQPSPWGACRMN